MENLGRGWFIWRGALFGGNIEGPKWPKTILHPRVFYMEFYGTPTTPATPVTPATPATPATPVTPATPKFLCNAPLIKSYGTCKVKLEVTKFNIKILNGEKLHLGRKISVGINCERMFEVASRKFTRYVARLVT